MANFPYDQTVPAANHAPKNDQPTMQTNAASISGLIAVDHVGFNSQATPGGYHKVIHFNNQGSDPGVVAGVGQLYTKTASSDQNLFYESGNGVITQLTGPVAPVPKQVTPSAGNQKSGYTVLPGGILLQYGLSNTVGTSIAITFPQTFSSQLMSIQLTGFSSSSFFYVSSQSTSGFTINPSGSSSSSSVYWVAIGF